MITRYNDIISDKINTTITIALFSDIHYNYNFKIERFEQIYNDLLENNIDYICIPGDIIDMTNIINDKRLLNELLYFFEDIEKIAPVIISLGNHDISKLINNKWYQDYNFEIFEKLSKFKNIHILNNDIFETKEIRFIGYTLPFNYYFNDTGIESECILIEDFIKKIPYIKNDKLNILLCHSPICIFNDNVLKSINSLKNVRLILTGHMHNGMIPGLIDEIFGGNKGIIYPNKKLFPKYARGITNTTINNNDISMIITGGITKVQESAPKKLQFLDNLYQSQINYIKIKSLKK